MCAPDAEAHAASDQGEATDSVTKEDKTIARRQCAASLATAFEAKRACARSKIGRT